MGTTQLTSAMEGPVIVAEPCVALTGRIKELVSDVLRTGCGDGKLRKELETYSSDCDTNTIPFRLVKALHNEQSQSGKPGKYLHEVLEGSSLHVPELPPPSRNPELEARLKKLRAQQENRDYKAMTKNVDTAQRETFSIAEDMREMNRQVWSVVNFVITVGGAFAFAYKATEYAFSGHDRDRLFILQMMMGLVFGTVVFFADLYFLIKEN